MLRRLIVFALLVVVGLSLYFWLHRVSLVERFLSAKLKAKVTIEDVLVEWGTFTLQGLQVENSSQRLLPYALQNTTLIIEVAPWKLLFHTVAIDRVKILHPTIGLALYNFSGSENNWAELLQGLSTGGSKKFIIRKLTILNLQFKIARANGKSFSLTAAPYLEFDNLGEKEALTWPQMSRVVVQTLLYQLNKKAHIGDILDQVTALPPHFLEGVRSPFSAGRTLL